MHSERMLEVLVRSQRIHHQIKGDVSAAGPSGPSGLLMPVYLAACERNPPERRSLIAPADRGW